MKAAPWVVGIIALGGGRQRAKSFDVAHALVGKRFACGRSMVVRWAGYKRARIVAKCIAAHYERRCKRCAHALEAKGRRRVQSARAKYEAKRKEKQERNAAA